MKRNVARQFKTGDRISYDDGRPGHQGVAATVLEVTEGHGILVQFDDRADTNFIPLSDGRWLDFIQVIE